MQWRFTLIDTTFGTTVTTVVPEAEGWNGAKFIFRRDLKWHGIFFDYTLGDLKFYGTGYSIIKDAYEEKGILATTDLLIEVQCAEETDYDTFFEGKLNYAKIKFDYGDVCGVSVGIEQTGCLQEFITRYDQKVNLASIASFDETVLSPYTFLDYETELPEKDIFYSSVADDAQTIAYTDTLPRLTGVFAQYFFQIYYANVDRDDLAMNNIECYLAGETSTLDDFSESCLGIIAPTDTTLLCATQDYDINIRLKGNFEEFSIDSRSYSTVIRLAYGNVTDGFTTVNLSAVTGHVVAGGATENTPFDFTYSATIPLRTGIDSLFVYARLQNYFYTSGSPSDPFQLNVTFEESSFSASVTSLCTPTNGKVFFINEALSRATEIITDDCMRVYSEYYGRTDSEPYAVDADGCGSNRFITNGLKVRNAKLRDGSEPLMSVSFKDLFDGLNPIDNIGIGIEDDDQRAAGFKRIRVEDVAFFYKTQLVALCTDVKDIEIKLDEKRIFSNIEIGYKKWESEQTGGLDDIHSKRQYRTEQSALANPLEIQSSFIASNYSFEITRRIGTSTEDWKYDNDTFIVCFERNVYGAINAVDDFEPSANANLIANIYYNQRISPVRNLLHWFKTIASTWSYEFLTQLKKLYFTSGEGNYVAGWRKTANDDCLLEDQTPYLYENQDIDKTAFKDFEDCKPLWHPETIEFDYPLSYQQFRSIRNNPYRLVQVTQGANTWYGWIEQLEYDVNEGMAKWKLIRQYENNY